MTLKRVVIPPDSNNPEEKHFWYYMEGQEQAIASIAYVYHHGFQKFRWELLDFAEENPIVIDSLEEGEAMLREDFGEITIS